MSNKSESKEQASCCVCYREKEIITTGCKHNLCVYCRFKLEEPKCPLCRKRLDGYNDNPLEGVEYPLSHRQMLKPKLYKIETCKSLSIKGIQIVEFHTTNKGIFWISIGIEDDYENDLQEWNVINRGKKVGMSYDFNRYSFFFILLDDGTYIFPYKELRSEKDDEEEEEDEDKEEKKVIEEKHYNRCLIKDLYSYLFEINKVNEEDLDDFQFNRVFTLQNYVDFKLSLSLGHYEKDEVGWIDLTNLIL